MARTGYDMRWVLTLLVGAFLILDGVAGILGANSFVGDIGRAFGAGGNMATLIVAIVEILAGALLVLGLFLDLGQLDGIVGFVIAIAWVVIIVFTYFIGRFNPDTLGWWLGFVQALIILAVIWMVKGRRVS
jgi:uncharacterized membrane protein YphA (DoxX/SURF4 family)